MTIKNLLIGAAIAAPVLLSTILFVPVQKPAPVSAASVDSKPEPTPKQAISAITIFTGKASYYSYTIRGVSSANLLVAAVRDFPRGSKILVRNLSNGKSVVVKVTDYGPNKKIHPDRVIDLSPRAFRELGDGTLRAGILKNVSIESIP